MTTGRPPSSTFAWLGLVIVALICVPIGFLGYAALGPDAVKIPPGVQAALILWLTVALAVLAGSGGAIVASQIAARSAEAIEAQKQQGALRSRLTDLTLNVAVEFVSRLQELQQELANQVARRQELAVTRGDPSTIPSLGSSDSLGEAAARLYLLADQQTADIAVDAYRLLVAAHSRYAFVDAQHRVDGRVSGLDPASLDEFKTTMNAITAARTRFMDAIRRQLNLRPLVAGSE